MIGERSTKSAPPRSPLACNVFSGRFGMVCAGPELTPDPTRPRLACLCGALLARFDSKGRSKEH